MSTSHDEQRRSVTWDISAGPRNYLTLVASQMIGSITSLLTVWLLTRLLGASGYGQVAAIIAAAFLIGTAGLNWSALSLVRIGCEEFVQTGRITETFWGRTLILTLNWIVVLSTTPLWLPPVAAWLQLSGEAQVLLFVYLAANSWWGHIQYALQGAKLQTLVGRLQAAERVLILAGAVILVTGSRTLTAVITIYAAGSLIASLIGFWQLRRFIGRPATPKAVLLRRILIFSLPLIPQSLVSYFSANYLDAWFILHYLSAADLGVYTIAYQLAGTAMQLPVLVSSLLLPMFTTLEVEGDDERLAGYMRNILPVLSLSWTLAGTLLAGLAVIFLPLIFGAQFTGAAPLMWPLMAACVIAGPMSMGYGPILNAKSATTFLSLGVLAAGATNLLLNFMLIPRWGLLGCAWATVGAYFVSLTTAALLFRRLSRIRGVQVIESVLPLAAGAAFANKTGNNGVGILLTLTIIFGIVLIRRVTLMEGAQRVGQILRRPRVAAQFV
jgi:O-antigen/teichoic acid export membrane protein